MQAMATVLYTEDLHLKKPQNLIPNTFAEDNIVNEATKLESIKQMNMSLLFPGSCKTKILKKRNKNETLRTFQK